MDFSVLIWVSEADFIFISIFEALMDVFFCIFYFGVSDHFLLVLIAYLPGGGHRGTRLEVVFDWKGAAGAALGRTYRTEPFTACQRHKSIQTLCSQPSLLPRINLKRRERVSQKALT